MELIRIPVRSLVEFILRSGDIDNRRGGGSDREAMLLGSRLHRKIQGRMGADYAAEVVLKEEFDCGTFMLSVEGRADGIFTDEHGTAVDEIKGVYRDVAKMEGPDMIHLAQAKCYACMYSTRMELDQIDVQMTYANLDTEEIRRFRSTYERKELREWFDGLVREYEKWARMEQMWKEERNASIAKTAFPYEYREGQKDLAASVYRTIWHRKKLFIQAPTGVGKTIAAVFPAVQAVGKGLGDRIFYLTAKTITRTVAQEAFSLLKKQELRYKVLTVTAKEKICFCGEPDCDPEKCPYAKGHFDRINDAVFELLTQGLTDYTRETICEHAEKWQVCPFEMSLDAALWADAVICDYNYVFDPQAKLKRFFAEGVKGDPIFLIDEAHNRVERGREMYSASLYKEDFLEVKRFLKPYSRKAERALDRCNKYMLEWKRECENYTLLSNIDAFGLSLLNVSSALELLLEEKTSVMNIPFSDPQKEEMRKKALDFYFQVKAFLDIYEMLDDSYEIYVQHEEDGRFLLKLYCIDTAGRIGECMAKGKASILFSATLLPVKYYMDLLSGSSEDYAVYAKSTFREERRRILLGLDVSTRYTRRSPSEYRRIAEYIARTIEVKKGNYMVFFPSYKMMEDVGECFAALQEDMREKVRIIVQSGRMTEAERESFLQEFQEDSEETLVGMCVMGGIFGEGIDLKKDRLIGALIVGTGLPMVCNEREILKHYYDIRRMDGFAYAYLYPGMNKVMQSAGRVIRTEEDRGVILLLDERFGQAQYRNIFPREWAGFETCTVRNVAARLEDFWKDPA